MESKNHFEGKARLEKILLENEYSINYRDGEISFHIPTEMGVRTYWPDILAWKDGEGWICFEIDGKVGHYSKTAHVKMRLRGTGLARLCDIRTVRIQTADLVGKRKQPVDIILKEINYQLK